MATNEFQNALSDLSLARKYNESLKGRFNASIDRIEAAKARLIAGQVSLTQLRKDRETVIEGVYFIIEKYEDWASDY